MTASRDLPPQLRDLSSKAQFLFEALRRALQVTLSSPRQTQHPSKSDRPVRQGFVEEPTGVLATLPS